MPRNIAALYCVILLICSVVNVIGYFDHYDA